MHPTKNDIPLEKRKKLVDVLSQMLADTLDLKLQAKQAHWNVKDPAFIALHELFDQVATEVEAAADMIAERVLQLGGEVTGTARFVAKNSSLAEYPLTLADGQKHADALSSAMAAYNAAGRKAIDETAALGDAITADMLTGIVRGLDKQMWFVESHIGESNDQRSQIAGTRPR